MAYRFQISANLLSWPPSCACFGVDADTKLRASAFRTTGKRVKHTTTSWWEVPYCSRCMHHKRVFDATAKWPVIGFVIGLLVWFLGGQNGNAEAGFFAGTLLGSLTIIPYRAGRLKARALMLPTCCTPSSAVSYIEWHGTFHTFVFASKLYLESFLSANSKKKRSDITKV
jgi:hypothetical protein